MIRVLLRAFGWRWDWWTRGWPEPEAYIARVVYRWLRRRGALGMALLFYAIATGALLYAAFTAASRIMP